MTTLGAAFPEAWFARRTHHHSEFADLGALVEAKRARSLGVSVCLPTRNEAATVGTVVQAIRRELVETWGLVDEIVVIDSMSTDGTVETARAAGATVHQDRDIAPEFEPFGGKGDALWKSLFVLSGDLIVFIDADIRNFDPHFVYGLLGPLLVDESLAYVKAIYERPIASEGAGLAATGGGRVTELVARPLINMFFPELAGFVQPLSGEYAGTRDLLQAIPFFTGYGVEFGLLVDVLERSGLDSMAQVDLDVRIHRNQSVPELSRMGFSVLQAAFHRLRSIGRLDLHGDVERIFHQFVLGSGGYEPQASLIEVRERPPAISVPSYRTRARRQLAGP